MFQSQLLLFLAAFDVTLACDDDQHFKLTKHFTQNNVYCPISGARNSHLMGLSGARNCPIMALSGARLKLEPFGRFKGPEIAILWLLLAPEIAQ